MALTSSGVTAAVLPAKRVVVRLPVRAPAPHAAARPVRLGLPARVRGAVAFRRRRPRGPSATHITHGPTVTPSLYERTTAPAILRAQGCRAGRVATNGLVVLDFGKLAYGPRRGGYGTLTFANRFASSRSLVWAVRSYARGYSECLPRSSRAHITLALGTSNYHQDVPSTYAAGRRWARMTARVGSYVKLHHFEHVTAAAGDDVEPAWDPSFRRTYDFFRGFGSVRSGYLLYNYGSLDGGVGRIWKLRQAYYVAGGMHAARAVPEIYNRAMAEQWGELARLSVHRYGRPIKIAGLMTQHRRRCRRCGYTAAQAHRALVRELARHPRTRVRHLATSTNIGAPAPVSSAELPRRLRR
ncbi:MAG TPA: hypothetical protein VFB42_06050 [Gaiellaceae bacterium]|nr:hypothetical protein [Gaiellaceae bacterium]